MNRRLAGTLAAIPLLAATALWAFTVTTDCLTAPANLTATSQNGNVTLTWDAVQCARAYGIHRTDIPQGIYGSLTATTFIDVNLRIGATARYFVTPIANETLIREGPASQIVQVVVR